MTLEREERMRRARIVIEGRQTEYWTIIKEKLSEWRNAESRYLDAHKKQGFKSDEEVKDYNRHVDRLNCLEWMMGINDLIIAEQQTALERMKETVQQVYRRAESFVKTRA